MEKGAIFTFNKDIDYTIPDGAQPYTSAALKSLKDVTFQLAKNAHEDEPANPSAFYPTQSYHEQLRYAKLVRRGAIFKYTGKVTWDLPISAPEIDI